MTSFCSCKFGRIKYNIFILDSRFLKDLNKKLGGAIVIRYCAEDDCGDFLWSHSTHSMIIGHMNCNDKSAKVSYIYTQYV